MSAQKRRVPRCTINWCCPYRSDLCKAECSGERKPKDDYMLVFGDNVLIRMPPNAGVHTRCTIPKRTKKVFQAFDRGNDMSFMVGQYYTFKAPKPD
jgi:hypothetical protein